MAYGDGDAELLGVDFGEVDVSPVGAAEGAGDDGLSSGFGDCRAIGGGHLDHKPAVRVVRVFQAADDELFGSNPDVIVSDVVGAVDVGGSSLVRGTPKRARLAFRQTKRLCPVRGAPSPMRAFSRCAAARVSHSLRCLSMRVRNCLVMNPKFALRSDCLGVLTWECCALPLRTVRPRT